MPSTFTSVIALMQNDRKSGILKEPWKLKITLLQCYEVLWTHNNVDAICTERMQGAFESSFALMPT